MSTTSDDEVREMLAGRAARADRVQVGPILDRALRAPAASGGAPWWRSLVALGGVAAAAVALVVAAVWFAGGAGPGPVASGPAAVGASPAATPSEIPTPSEQPSASATASVPPTTQPSPSEATPSPSPAGPIVCTAADLTAHILDWQGAAGSRIADIELTSRDGASCVVRGRPQVVLLDSHHSTLIDSAQSGSGPAHVAPSDPPYLVSPGHPLRTQVATSNYCGPEPSLPLAVGFVLADGGSKRLVATPVAGVDESLAVPPCNGQGSPATITTNGWTR